MEMSVRQELEQFKAEAAKVAPLDAEVKRLTLALDEQKAKHTEAVASIEAVKADAQKDKDALEAKATELAGQLAEKSAALEAAQKKLALEPFAAGEGAKETPGEGGEAKVEKPVDHRAVVESLSGAERLKYYREHKAEIDAAYNVKQ